MFTATIPTLAQAHTAAKKMTAAEFSLQYDQFIEWMDVDNIGDENEGYFNISFHAADGEMDMLFVDGKLQSITTDRENQV